MPISLEWYNNAQTCLLIRFENQWTINHFHQMLTKADCICEDICHPFAVIVDLSSSATPPLGIINIRNRIPHIRNPYFAGAIVINSQPIFTMLTNVFAIAIKVKIQMAESVEEALMEVEHIINYHQSDAPNAKSE